MAELIPQEDLNAVIDPKRARRFYEDGADRWRMPRRNRHSLSDDTDSMDFRGVRAAMAATDTLVVRDEEGHLLPIDPDHAQEHYRLGLVAVGEAGLLPLDQRFVAGYERLAGAIVAEAVEKQLK